MWMIVFGPDGPSLFQHIVVPFGPKGAVWSYNRVGDCICAIGALLLASICIHYVDDYAGVEPAETSTSSFEGFESLNDVMAFKMKASRR